MDWYAFIFGTISGIIGVAIVQLLPKKLKLWIRFIIAILIATVLALIIRLVFDPFQSACN